MRDDEAGPIADTVIGRPGGERRPEPSGDTTLPVGAGGARAAMSAVESTSYELGDELARGGMGRIRRARDRRLQRPVAIKELIVNAPALARRFEREVLITARLQHPSIVSVYEAGRWPDGTPFYAMRMVSGRSLDAVIAERATIDARLALLPNVIAVTEALAYAHGERVIHRDLKPGNVLVGPFGETVVIDWGLAKDLGETDDELPAAPARSPELTAAGSVMGTPAYMAPEQAKGLPVDERADVYALGGILYHVLAGSPPVSRTSADEALEDVIRGRRVPLATVEPTLSPDLVAIVDKALAVDPADRYPTAAELAADLVRFQTGQLVGARRYSASALLRRWIGRHRRVLAVVAVAVIALAAVGVGSVVEIVRERDLAGASRDDAQRQRAAAVAAEDRAIVRADDAVIAQARLLLAVDPAKALAVLTRLSERPPSEAARRVAASAREAGVAIVLPVGDIVTAIAFSPDGTTVATGDYGGAIRLWDAAGRPGHGLAIDELVWRLAFAPDGTLVVAASSHGVRRWDLVTGAATLVATHDGTMMPTFAIAADGSLAISDAGGAIITFARDGTPGHAVHVAANTVILQPRDRDLVVLDPAGLAIVSADGARRGLPALAGIAMKDFIFDQLVAPRPGVVGLDAGVARILDLATGRVHSVAGAKLAVLSPDAQRLATAAVAPAGSATREVWLYDLATGARRELTLASEPEHAAFSPDGTLLAVATRTGEVVAWNVVSGATLALHGHAETVHCLAFSPDSKRLATGGTDQTARIWDLAPLAWQPLAIPGRVQRSARLADGRGVVMVATDGVWQWRPPGAPVRLGEARPEAAAAIADDGSAVALQVGTVIRVIRQDGTTRDLATTESRVDRIAVSRDGRRVVWRSFDEPFAWTTDLASGRAIRVDASPQALAFAPDGDRLAVVDLDGVASLVDLAAGTTRALAAAPAPPTPWVGDPRFSADGRLLAIGRENQVLVWNLDPPGPARVLAGHTNFTNVLEFDRDARHLISGSKAHEIFVWDLATGEHRALAGHGALIGGLALSPDGRSLVSTALGEVRRWDLATGIATSFAPAPDWVATAEILADGSTLIVEGAAPIAGRVIADDVPRDHAGFAAWLAKQTNARPE